MFARFHSAAPQGVDASAVEVEVNATGGDFKMVVVGLPDTAVKESSHRVKTAVENSGFSHPYGHTTINIAPADARKEGPSFDLPIALGILACTGQLDAAFASDYFVAGELALDGAVRPVRGVLPIALEARRRGMRGVVVPADNATEAAVVSGIEAIPVRNLREAFEWFGGARRIEPKRVDLQQLFADRQTYEVDFSEVKGQESVKRALEVAAAGGHNVLMVGPPGSGKSMLAKRLPTILPRLTLEEALETTKVHSIAGLLGPDRPLVTTRPFRSPHHTVSDVGLAGGGTNPQPGEISLAHHGVLFLDELPEFKRSALEVMRQPLEDGHVTISRASGTMTYPARIMLIAAMNPTPDGKMVGQSKSTPQEIRRYLAKISGPLLDRIDLHVEAAAVSVNDLTGDFTAESSAVIRARVEAARERQRERFAASPRTRCNAQMTAREMKTHCALAPDCLELLKAVIHDRNLSARAYDRILKVSRTIADLAASAAIEEDHVMEAVQYRGLDRQLWGE